MRGEKRHGLIRKVFPTFVFHEKKKKKLNISQNEYFKPKKEYIINDKKKKKKGAYCISIKREG